jgi:hypothetical protein
MSSATTTRWTRGAGRVWIVAQAELADGGLYDHLRGRAITPDDAPVLVAQVTAADLSPIAGAVAVSLSWDASLGRWAGEAPYLTAFDAMTQARVRVTVTVGSRTARLRDTLVSFVD